MSIKLAAFIPQILGAIVRKTFTKEGVKENLEQASTRAAVGAAAVVGAIEAIPVMTDSPKNEAELIVQVLAAIVALFLYYRDDGKFGKSSK